MRGTLSGSTYTQSSTMQYREEEEKTRRWRCRGRIDSMRCLLLLLFAIPSHRRLPNNSFTFHIWRANEPEAEAAAAEKNLIYILTVWWFVVVFRLYADFISLLFDLSFWFQINHVSSSILLIGMYMYGCTCNAANENYTILSVSLRFNWRGGIHHPSLLSILARTAQIINFAQ